MAEEKLSREDVQVHLSEAEATEASDRHIPTNKKPQAIARQGHPIGVHLFQCSQQSYSDPECYKAN